MVAVSTRIRQLLIEAVRLLRESHRNFKSRHVAEARRLIESAITLTEDHDAEEIKAGSTETDGKAPQPVASKTQSDDRS